MSKLTDDDVRYVARLSRFNLTDEERARFKIELESILHYVEQLKDIDTEGVKPTAQVTGLVNQTRPDEIREYGVDRASLLKNAPEHDDDSVKVPRVL